VSTKKRKPDRAGSNYTDEELKEWPRYVKLRATIPHVTDYSILEIVRNDIAFEWEQIKQTKVRATIKKCVTLLRAAGFEGNRFVIDVEDDGSVRVLSKKINRNPIPICQKHKKSKLQLANAGRNGTSDEVLKDAQKKPSKRAENSEVK